MSRLRSRRRLSRSSSSATAVLLSLLLVVGCGSEDAEIPELSTPVDPPPAETGAELIALDPSSPQPGEPFAVSFDASNSRGGYFFLYRWDGADWGEPLYLLQSDAGGRTPSASLIGEGSDIDDYGIEGPGPDGLVAPDDMARGFWRLCTANAADDACAQFEVSPADQ